MRTTRDLGSMTLLPDRGLGAAPLRPLVLAFLGSLILLGLTILGILSSSRGFQVDEVEHIHAAYNVKAGKLIYADFRQDHNPLLYYALWPAIDPQEPEASYRNARRVTTALFVLNVALCGLCAFRLAGPEGGVLASGLALCHTTFVERGMEVRTDGPMALAVVAALAVELSGLGRLKRYCLEALLLSLAFLFTNKACFACFAFGCLWLAESFKRRRPVLVAAPMAVWLVPVLFALALMALAGSLNEFLDINFRHAVTELTHTGPHSHGFTTFTAWRYLRPESLRNVAFCLVALLGWAIGISSWLRRGGDDRIPSGLRFTTFLAGVLALSLWLNPFPYPYLHVSILPAFMVLSGVAGSRIIERLRLKPQGPGAWAVVLVLLLGAGLQGLPYLARRSVSFLEQQFETLREIQSVTAPGDAVFDLVGLYFRPDGHYVYNMTKNMLAIYGLGEVGGIPRISDELRSREVVAFIMNYRFEMLPVEDQWFLHNHFVHFDGNVFLEGSRLLVEPGQTIDFEVLKSKEFRYDGEGSILVDGKPFRTGALEKGAHVITRIERHGKDRLVMAAPSAPWPPRPPVQLFDFF